MVSQNAAHVEAVTPLNVSNPVMSWLVEVAFVVDRRGKVLVLVVVAVK